MKPEAPLFINGEARWLAACMASESERHDRVLNDPYASRLAGVRGARVFEERTDDERAFAAVVGVAVADDLVRRVVIDHHLHSVLHLGAGLDTRPYRLGLPNDLRWVELDLEGVFLYKIFRLTHVAPTCHVERVSVDLTDAARMTSALRRAARGVARGLLLTEPALDRFAPDVLKDISAHVPGGLKWWVLGAPRGGPATQSEAIAAVCGTRWKVADRRPLGDEAQRRAPARHTRLATDRGPSGDAVPGTTIWLLRRVT